MATLQSRSGRINIRVGGNSQEEAVLVDTLPNGRVLAKGGIASNPVRIFPCACFLAFNDLDAYSCPSVH